MEKKGGFPLKPFAEKLATAHGLTMTQVETFFQLPEFEDCCSVEYVQGEAWIRKQVLTTHDANCSELEEEGTRAPEENTDTRRASIGRGSQH